MDNPALEMESPGENVDADVRDKPKQMIRVILWSAPRSLSTAFERCMTRVPNTKIFNEMYAAAHLLGPERIKRWWPKLAPRHSYRYCKERLESDMSSYDFVFVKDFAFGISEHIDMLPSGYLHTFLIRDPLKMFTSLKATVCSSLIIKTLSLGGKIQRCFPTKGYFYKDMWELYSHMKDHPDHPVPVILDADDIIRDPEVMIRKYCEMIGVTFDPEILKWEPSSLTSLPWEGAKFFRIANWLTGCYKNALNSTGFKKGGIKKDGTNKSNGVVPKAEITGNAETVDRTGADVRVEQNGIEANGVPNGTDIRTERNDNDVTVEENGTSTPAEQNSIAISDETNGAIAKNNVAPAKPAKPTDLSSLDSDIRKAVEFSQPYYDLLYKCRVTLDTVEPVEERPHSQ